MWEEERQGDKRDEGEKKCERRCCGRVAGRWKDGRDRPGVSIGCYGRSLGRKEKRRKS